MFKFKFLPSSSRRISMGALERPSFTNRREMSTRKKRGPGRPRPPLKKPVRAHDIVTLDPNKFAEKKQHRLHIGNLLGFVPHISLLKQSSPVIAPRIDYDIAWLRSRYPPDTKAFLYYLSSPERPRIAGELRLRLASGDSCASFKGGSDLLRSNGRPWSRPLYCLAKNYFLLYEKLREERLVSDDLDTVLSTLPKADFRFHQRQLLYTLNDTFLVDFSKNNTLLYAITEQGVKRIRLHRPFLDCREKYLSPYTGSALARFERSTLRDHKGTRTVVLRFLKIITPVECVKPFYDGYISCPKEGELYQRNKHEKRLVWRVNIDKRNDVWIQGLQLLWDT